MGRGGSSKTKYLLFIALALTLITAFTIKPGVDKTNQPAITPTTTTKQIVTSSSSISDGVKTSTSLKNVGITGPAAGVYADIEKIHASAKAGDSEGCDEATDPSLALARDMCHYTVALNQRDKSKCGKINDPNMKSTCESRIDYFLDQNMSREGIEENTGPVEES